VSTQATVLKHPFIMCLLILYLIICSLKLPEETDESAENMKDQYPGTEIKASMAGFEFYDYEAEVEAA